MISESLTLGGLAFEVRRSDRRRSIGMSVGRQGQLNVFAPMTLPIQDVSVWVEKKLLWVHRKLSQKRGMFSNGSRPEFVTGESFSYLGRTYKLRLVDHQKETLTFDGHGFLLRRGERGNAEKHFGAWYRRNGIPWIEARVQEFVRRVNASPNKIVVRNLSYRWGSCSRKGTISFHWKLFQLPVRLVDYVIAHELVHLVEPHHGPNFWGYLDRTLPDWRERKEELARWATGYLRFNE